MTANISVKRVILNINGKELTLTLEEAKELKDLLNDVFGEKETIFPYPPINPVPYREPYYVKPYIIWTKEWDGTGTVTFTTTGSSESPISIY